MIKIGMVIPTWGKQCGVADYARNLMDHTKNNQFQFEIFTDVDKHLVLDMKRQAINIVHFQYEYSIYKFDRLYPVMTELNKMGLPVITTLHSWNSDMVPDNLLLSSTSSLIIVHSDPTRQICIEHGYPVEKLVVKPMGCQSYKLEPSERTRRLFDIKGYPRIGFFGFPFPHKGIEKLIDALDELKVYFPNLKGYFFAHYPDYLNEDHAYYDFLQTLQKCFRQQEHLVWVKEFLPETALVNLLHTMDINVLPYTEHFQKGISSAVRLMFAAKRPIVTTDYLYFSDLTDEVYKMPNEESETIAASLCKVLLNSSLQEKLVFNGNRFLEKNDWEWVGEHFRALYKKITSEKKGES